MKSDATSQTTVVSEAKLRANRANAQHSPGPRDTSRSRLNARKHGLFGQIAWLGQDVGKDQQFSSEARTHLGPRNPMEEVCVKDLLQARLEQKLLLELEYALLTRRPVMSRQNDGPYPFLADPKALNALEALTRRLAQSTRITSKAFSELLRVRQEPWAEAPQEDDPPDQTDSGPVQGPTESTVALDPTPGTFLACLVQPKLLLPGEDLLELAALAGKLWVSFGPINTLEGFLTTDFIEIQWCLERVLRIQRLVFERSAVSASGHNCGYGFAFLQDAKGCGALGALRGYEVALRKASDKTMASWRKVRKQGWQDAVPFDPGLAQSTAIDTPHDSQALPAEAGSESRQKPQTVGPAFSVSPENCPPGPAATNLSSSTGATSHT